MTAKISAAFVAAQKAFGPALKSSSNPHFKSRYADLAACVEAVIDALNANGIGLMQKTLPAESGVSVETVLVHESGETLSSGPLHVPASKGDAQGYGSALTYARRYSLMAACGIAPEDDDGNAASRNTNGTAKGPGSISGPAESYRALSPDWQQWVDGWAADVENRFTQLGPGAANELIAETIERENLDPGTNAALFFKLSSKTRAALKSAK